MRILVQRVSQASVKVEGALIGAIGCGIVALVGFGQGDDETLLGPMAEKLAHLRIFPDEQGRFNHSVKDIGGGVLLVPQFTLYADTSRGRRPDFFGALEPTRATRLFDQFVGVVGSLGLQSVETGRFGAHMMVLLENDGPVTIMLESAVKA